MERVLGKGNQRWICLLVLRTGSEFIPDNKDPFETSVLEKFSFYLLEEPTIPALNKYWPEPQARFEIQ